MFNKIISSSKPLSILPLDYGAQLSSSITRADLAFVLSEIENLNGNHEVALGRTSKPPFFKLTSRADHYFERFNSSLHLLKKAGIDPLRAIRRLSKSKSSITILEWGCGGGHALSTLSLELEKIEATHHRLFGLSNVAYPTWRFLPPDVSIIFDEGRSLGRYFEPHSVQLIYSFFGLYHLKRLTESDIKEHLLVLKTLLSTDGIILTNKTATHLDRKFPGMLQGLGFIVASTGKREGEIWTIAH